MVRLEIDIECWGVSCGAGGRVGGGGGSVEQFKMQMAVTSNC